MLDEAELLSSGEEALRPQENRISLSARLARNISQTSQLVLRLMVYRLCLIVYWPTLRSMSSY